MSHADTVVLNETGYWRQYVRFGPDRVSAALLKREGEQLLGKDRMAGIKADVMKALQRRGVDPATTDWRNHVLLRMFFDPYSLPVLPPPPRDWTDPDYDDSAWVLKRGMFGSDGVENTGLPRGPGWTDEPKRLGEFSSIGIRSCHFRARFVVKEPTAVADLTCWGTYRGGIRIFVNGHEITRANLPDGNLADDTPADDYPIDAYDETVGDKDKFTIRDHTLGPVKIPASLLRQGVNILAVEVRASCIHPVALKSRMPLMNHKVRQGMVGLWRHCGMSRFEIMTSSDAVFSSLKRPAGMAIWAQDMHHRVSSDEFLPPGEPAGVLRLVGARNGICSGQVVVATDKPLKELRARVTDLHRIHGTEKISAGAFRVCHMHPFPAVRFTDACLGDDRGLGAWFPSMSELNAYREMKESFELWIFDQITVESTADVPANTCRPMWVSGNIPSDAVPGCYEGTVQITARNVPVCDFPIRLEVIGWRVPEPRNFRTVMCCEENPCLLY
ncbi:MAG: hypothetical protein N2255_03205, partial [Kiritimatiellae bacterium]|nr:hypothetical protein [Kiritimatiellia bacterium]